MENMFNGVMFRLHGSSFAIDALKVREIVGGAEWKPLSVEGEQGSFIQIRGKTALVVDLREKLGFPPATGEGLNSFIAVQAPGNDRNRLVALWIDAVLELVNIPGAQLKAPPETFQLIPAKYLRFITEISDQTVYVLNADELLNEIFSGALKLALQGKAS